MAGKQSAGLLLYRLRQGEIEVLLVHPGGPLFAKKDAGAWSIPKGEIEGAGDMLDRACIEFREELGADPPPGPYIPLGSVKQKGGKTVHAWACEGDSKARSGAISSKWNGRRAQGKWPGFPRWTGRNGLALSRPGRR